MEVEYRPARTDEQWHEYWLQQRWDWYVNRNLAGRPAFEHPKEKLSHYSRRTVDIEYRFRFARPSSPGWRASPATDFDLTTPRTPVST